MEKIFDAEVCDFMKKAGIKDEDILKIRYEKLKEKVLERLMEVHNLISNEKFDRLDELLAYSPSGDGYGSDNNYIDFSHITGDRSLDISEAVDRLIELNRMNTTSKKERR